MQKSKRNILPIALLLVSGLGLQACMHDDDDDNDEMTMKTNYQIEVVNLTADQPLTPLAAVLHKGDYTAWQLGESASAGLEAIAEGGDVTGILNEAESHADFISSVSSSNGPFPPGQSEMISLSADEDSQVYISLASMLANTNDAFTGINKLNISELMNGESLSLYLKAYDAGTEKNTESESSMPGPADGGEGFNMARDEYATGEDFVSIHRGVVSQDDGLSSSVLNETHRWNGPVAKLTITRLN